MIFSLPVTSNHFSCCVSESRKGLFVSLPCVLVVFGNPETLISPAALSVGHDVKLLAPYLCRGIQMWAPACCTNNLCNGKIIWTLQANEWVIVYCHNQSLLTSQSLKGKSCMLDMQFFIIWKFQTVLGEWWLFQKRQEILLSSVLVSFIHFHIDFTLTSDWVRWIPWM